MYLYIRIYMYLYTSTGEPSIAVEEGLALVNSVLPQNNEKSLNSVISTQPLLSALPEICRNIILSAASRLPFLEKDLDCIDAALDSFHRCVSGDSVLKHYYPLPLQLGLNVETALLMLNRSKNLYTPPPSSTGGKEGVLDYKHASEAIRADVDNAYSLLSASQSMLFLRTDPPQEPAHTPTGIDPLHQSMLRYKHI
jgi:hypothetical protein